MDEQILAFFEKAKHANSQEEANGYVKKARTLAMKKNTRLPREIQQLFCKHCYSFFSPNNFRVRKQENAVIYTCETCKKQTRYLM